MAEEPEVIKFDPVEANETPPKPASKSEPKQAPKPEPKTASKPAPSEQAKPPSGEDKPKPSGEEKRAPSGEDRKAASAPPLKPPTLAALRANPPVVPEPSRAPVKEPAPAASSEDLFNPVKPVEPKHVNFYEWAAALSDEELRALPDPVRDFLRNATLAADFPKHATQLATIVVYLQQLRAEQNVIDTSIAAYRIYEAQANR